MNKQVKALLASYARSFIVAAVAVYSTGNTEPKQIIIAGAIAVIAPALRALNSKDSAFGVVADVVTVELDKLAKADKKKAAPKKKSV